MLCFIDETGDHSLNKIDPTYPIFGLGAFCISEDEYSRLVESVNDLKRRYFEGDDFIFHSSELKRPDGKRSDQRNFIMKNSAVRAAIYRALDGLLDTTKFELAVCFIRKEAHRDTYARPADPYNLSFENILNRALWYTDSEPLKIIAECRSYDLDTALMAEYERLCRTGARFHGAERIRTISTLVCQSKQDNVIGLQVIDLMLSCLTRHYLGKTEKMIGNDLNPRLLERKFGFLSPTFFPRK